MNLNSELNVSLRLVASVVLLTWISLNQSASSQEKLNDEPESFPRFINYLETITTFPKFSWNEGESVESISDSSYRLIVVSKNVVGPLANAIFENFPELQDELDIQTTVRGVVFNADIEVEESFDKELRQLVSAIKADVKKHSDVQLYVRIPKNARNSAIKNAQFHGYLSDCELSEEPIFNDLYSMRGRAALVHRSKREIKEFLTGMEKHQVLMTQEVLPQKSEPGNDGEFLHAVNQGFKEPIYVGSPEQSYESLLSQIEQTQIVYFEQAEGEQAEAEKRLAEELEQLSEDLWEAEQELLKNQVIEMKRRLSAIEKKLSLREEQREKLVKRRVEALKKRKPNFYDLPRVAEPPFPQEAPIKPATPRSKPPAPHDPFANRDPNTIRPADASKPRKNDPFAEDIYESEWEQPEPPAETDATRAVETLLNANSGELVITPRQQTVHNLTKLNQALLNYHAANGHFPPASKSLLKQGIPVNAGNPKPTPRFSWRVELLPWLGEQDLYNQYRTDEPWDSEHNKKLLAKMPDVYRSALDPSDSQNSAYYVVVSESTRQVGKPEYITLFGNPAGAKYKDVHDGTTNTIAMVELDLEIPWTKPEDLKYDPAYAIPNLPTFEETGFHACFVDGSVRFIPKETPVDLLRHFFEMNDGMPTKLPPVVNSFGTVLLQPVKPQSNLNAVDPFANPTQSSSPKQEKTKIQKLGMELLKLELDTANQRLEVAKREMMQKARLIEKGVATESDLDTARIALAEATVQVKRAELALERGDPVDSPPETRPLFEAPKSRKALQLDLKVAVEIDMLAKNELTRNQRLFETGVVSETELIDSKIKATKASYEVEKLKLALNALNESESMSTNSGMQSPFENPLQAQSVKTPRQRFLRQYTEQSILSKLRKALEDSEDLLPSSKDPQVGFVIGVSPAASVLDFSEQLVTLELVPHPDQPEVVEQRIISDPRIFAYHVHYRKGGYEVELVSQLKFLHQSGKKVFALGALSDAEANEQRGHARTALLFALVDGSSPKTQVIDPPPLNDGPTSFDLTPSDGTPISSPVFAPAESIPSPIIFKNSKEVKTNSKKGAQISRGSDSYFVTNAVKIEHSAAAIQEVLNLPKSEYVSISRGSRNDIVSITDNIDLLELAKALEKIVKAEEGVYLLKHDDGHLIIDAGPKKATEITKSVLDAVQKSQSNPKKNQPAENEEASLPFEMKLPIDVTTGAIGSDVFSFYIGIMR